MTLRALHTPCHRPEHTAWAVIDRSRGDEPCAVLTGDSLFVGDVARPDLAIEKSEGTVGRTRKYGNSTDVPGPTRREAASRKQSKGREPRTGVGMDLYVIIRRNGWATPADLEEAAARSTAEGDKENSGVRWIRSYVLGEESGEVGTVCIYEAESPEAIRAHADAADLPVDEIIPVADTVIVRPDPVPAGA